MTEAPLLRLAEVRQEVERIFRRDHRSKLVALFGRGEPSDFDLGGQPWQVIPTRCELELREQLPGPEDSGNVGRVYLIDWTSDLLPLDISCRMAGGRLYPVARDARLAALFGARQVEPGLAGSAVARLVLAGAVQNPKKIQGLQLSRADVWQNLLEVRLHLPEVALGSAAALLSWAARSAGGPAFVRLAIGDDLWRNARRELHEWLRQSLGEPAVVVWQAWELGLAPRLLEILPLVAAARTTADAFLAGQLLGLLSAWLPELGPAVRGVEAALADETFLGAALPRSPDELLATLEHSQALADRSGLGALTTHSPRLPGGHVAAERALALATQSALAAPGAEASAELLRCLSRLEAHALDAQLRSGTHREARRNLPRLALWLSSRPVAGPSGTRWQPTVDLARAYAEEGGFVEWARQQLRGLREGDEALLKAARDLEEAVGLALHEDNRTFAEAYGAWVDAGKPAGHALPIEQVGKHIIASFLQANVRRKLLVVLMDGMSQAAGAQLLTRLASARRWGPIAWRKEGWLGRLPLPPVLAVAPTLTELSRGGFFAGKADPRFGEEGTDKDPSRWAAHRVVADLLGEGAPPLFMRRDIQSGYDLNTDIREAIKGDCRAVAVVVNAIDEDLKSSVQVAKDYSQAPVLALEALLSAAEEGDRVVLLIADHGHILGDGTRPLPGRLSGGRPGGARWRALAQGEAPADEEVLLPTSSWVPRGWHRVAVLWDASVVNRSASYGEHGGLSLAEAVAPAILIAPVWLERAFPDDPGLAVRPLLCPDWWDLRIRKITAAPPAPPPERPLQAALFAVPPRMSADPATPAVATTRAAAPAPPASPPLIEALRRSTVFQAQVQGQPAAEIERVLSWLGALAAAGGAMPAADFAAAGGLRAHQVGGAVARMGLLNADGFAMVEHDHVGRRVVLHRARLTQHYAVRD